MGVMPAITPSLPTIRPPASRTPGTVFATIIPVGSGLTLSSSSSTPSLGVVSASTTNPSHTATATVASASSVAVSAAGSLAITSSAATAVACHLLGEGLAPLPAKLWKRILSLEFVEMADLLPEAWLLEETVMEAQLRRPVTDILLWVQCFATFAVALGTAFPDKVPELMAYMTTIVRCHRDYEGPAWVLYDRAFRRRAEATKDMNWSVMNTSLFNMCFGGRARRHMICQVCLSESHTTERCPRRVVPLGNTLTYSAAIQATLGYLMVLSGRTPHAPQRTMEFHINKPQSRYAACLMLGTATDVGSFCSHLLAMQTGWSRGFSVQQQAQ